jgi:hypothetical protein
MKQITRNEGQQITNGSKSQATEDNIKHGSATPNKFGQSKKSVGQCVTSQQVPCKVNNKRGTHSIECNSRLHSFKRFAHGVEYWECKWPKDIDV